MQASKIASVNQNPRPSHSQWRPLYRFSYFDSESKTVQDLAIYRLTLDVTYYPQSTHQWGRRRMNRKLEGEM